MKWRLIIKNYKYYNILYHSGGRTGLDWPLPRYLFPEVVVEPAVLFAAEVVDDLEDPLDTLAGGQRRVLPPHVSLDPARVERHGEDVGGGQVETEGLADCVHTSLGGSVGVETALGVLRYGAENAGDVDNKRGLGRMTGSYLQV